MSKRVIFSIDVFPEAPIHSHALSDVVAWLRLGECCALVGPSNTGKSLLLRALLSDEMRRLCAQPGRKAPSIIFIDCLDGVGDTEASFYELLLRRATEVFTEEGAAPSVLDKLRELHHQLLLTTNPVAVRSFFGSAVFELSRASDLPDFVLILDEFDDVFRKLPPWPFRQLRALRDAAGARMPLIVATSRYLYDLRQDDDTYEFRELFQMNTCTLGPLPAGEAELMLDHLEHRYSLRLSRRRRALAIDFSGGHPGLLERVARELSRHGDDVASADEAVDLLLSEPAIVLECRRLWSELEVEEQTGLFSVVCDGAALLSSEQELRLRRKGLIRDGDSEQRHVFSPLFAEFIRQVADQRQKEAYGVRCDRDTGRIWVDGRELTLELSEPQRRLLRFLHAHAGEVCTQQSIVEAVWETDEGVSPGALYELVKRVRKKIESDWHQPRHLVTVAGAGYRLERLG